MKILIVAFHDLLVRLQDRSAVFLIFLAPLLIISLAALSFKPVIHHKRSADTGSTPLKLVVVNLDTNIKASHFDQALLLMSVPLQLEVVDRAPNDLQRLQPNVVVINLAADHSQQLLASHEPQSRLSLTIESQSKSGFDLAQTAEFIKQLTRVITQPLTASRAVSLVDAPIDSKMAVPRENALSLAYFAPSMMIFFLMYAAFGGTRTLLKDKESGLLARLLYLPIAPFSLLLGKILAVFMVALLQLFILILCSALLLGMDWGNSMVGLAALCVVLAAAFTSFGIFIAIFTKDANQANVIGMGVILLFSSLGGNFVPVSSFPQWIQQISLISLNRWGLDGILDLTMRQQSIEGVFLELGVLSGFTLVFFSLSLWRFQQQVTR